MTAGAPTTVVFDLGGVLLDWDPRHLYRRLLPDDAAVEAFLDDVGFAAWNHLQDAGGSWAEAVEAHSLRYPQHAELLAAYPRRFLEAVRGEVAGTAEVLRELHEAGVRLLALTNWSAETFPAARTRFATILDLFEDIVVSGVERLAKPDPAIFELLLNRFDLRAASTVFVDDSPVNVRAATEAGMVAITFHDHARLRADLEELGLLT